MLENKILLVLDSDLMEYMDELKYKGKNKEFKIYIIELVFHEEIILKRLKEISENFDEKSESRAEEKSTF